MPRKKKKIHYIYKTTCLVTNRYYVGMHSTSNLNDGYMGSGKRLRYSIRKYGEENHKVEILEFYESRELLIEAEIEAITPEMITDKDCMNLTEGGTGGHGARFLTKEQLAKGGRNAIDKIHHTQWVTNGDKNRERLSRECKERWDNSMEREKMLDRKDWSGKKHSEETKKLMSESKRGKGIGETNSQYGTCWITRNDENKKIKKEELEFYIKEGWKLGRKLKH